MLNAVMTTYNRKALSVACVESLKKAYSGKILLTDADAGSTDGTAEALKAMENEKLKVKVIGIPSDCFWNMGMRKGLKAALSKIDDNDLVLLLNDDVVFYENSLDELEALLLRKDAAAVVGAFKDGSGCFTYGGVRQTSSRFARFEPIYPGKDILCDTFNCNCLLTKKKVLKATGNLDRHYVHSLGDYDLGLRMKALSLPVFSAEDYTGECETNKDEGSWKDASLSMKKRIRLKESPRGLPFKDWFYFVRKHYGVCAALYHSLTPYIRILIRK